jgi:predicted esterase
VNRVSLKNLAAAALVAAPLACIEVDETASSLRAADAFNYTGSIRVSLGEPTPVANEYRLHFSANTTVQSLGLCSLRTVSDAASCKPGVQGYYETEVTTETAARRFFRAKNVAVLQEGLILALQGIDNTGAVLDTRVIRFNAGSGGSGTATGTGTGTSTNAYETKGSGGQTGAYDGTFGQGGRFKMVAASDNSATKSHGLLVFLHGSTASNYAEFAQANAQVAQQNGLMSVSVLAPNGQGWNETDGREAAKYLDDLIEGKLFKEYNIDRRKIFFHGQSSGAGFLSSHFVAMYGKNFGGGALMLCGASRPEVNVEVNDAMKAGFRLYYDLTTNDEIWTDRLVPSIEAYRAAGLKVESTSEGQQKPGGHCQFDQQQILSEKIPEILRLNGT